MSSTGARQSSDRFPTSLSSLHFTTSPSFLSQTLASLHNSTNSTHNRLASIHKDAQFVQKVAYELDLPLIANERCGSWYISPERKAGSVYFKSTDGHFGEWAFSKRRLNLHMLQIIEKHGGCIIVDSTRRGKSMPDALAKTIPIWCVVINRLLFPENKTGFDLFTPRDVVSASEHVQIEARINDFVDGAKALALDLPSLRKTLQKPLRPSWATPSNSQRQISDPGIKSDFYNVICCTASRRVHHVEASEGFYVQGAGDDSEVWAHGLSPEIFWQHNQAILNSSDSQLPDLIQDLLSQRKTSFNLINEAVVIAPTNSMFIGDLTTATEPSKYDGVVLCVDDIGQNLSSNAGQLCLKCGSGKLGSRALRMELPRIPLFISSLTFRNQTPKILFACSTGRDLAVGAALVVLCLFFDNDHTFNMDFFINRRIEIDKTFIRQRLAWITSGISQVNPSRSTLQAVNSFLMGNPHQITEDRIT